jgi:hypothetical protein
MEIERIIHFLGQEFEKFPNSQRSNIFIFSNLLKLKFNRDKHHALIEGLVCSFPQKAFFFPGYTYNSRSRLEYTPSQPPNSQCGSLSRVVYEDFKSEVMRTFDEDYSYLVLNSINISPSCLEETLKWKNSSFGKNSHHEALFDDPGYFLVIADEMESGFTPSMHCEALVGVKYREMIDIPSVIDSKKIKHYYSRVTSRFNYFGKGHRKQALSLLESRDELLSTVHANGSSTYLFSTDSYLQVVTEALTLNPDYFLGDLNASY